MPKIDKSPDAHLTISLENGPEVFTANDPMEATQKLAEALDHGKKWGNEGWEKARLAEAKLAQLETTRQQVAPPPVDANEKQLQDYLLNQTAKALGYENGEQYKAELTRVKGTVSQVSQSNALQQFFTSHPEFPGTQEANDMIGKIFDEKGWTDMTADNLHFAHLEAVDRHRRDPKQGYEPLSAEAVNQAWANQMQQSNRQPPPPMLRGNNPEQIAPGVNPYAMPLNDLRKQAIEQELSRK